MSVLTCPVCQGAMREVNKEGILIDVCSQCRGVWLDRGELEKLTNLLASDYGAPRQVPPYDQAVARGPAPYDQAPARGPAPYDQASARGPAPYDARPPQDDYAYRERRRDWDDDDDDDHYRQRGDRRYHKKSGFGRFLDIFD
jgi:uncharacterized protein